MKDNKLKMKNEKKKWKVTTNKEKVRRTNKLLNSRSWKLEYTILRWIDKVYDSLRNRN